VIPGGELNWLPFRRQLQLSVPADIAVKLQRGDAGVALHILRYDYNAEQDKVSALEELNLDLRLPEKFSILKAFSPSGPPQAELEFSGDLRRVALKNIPLYSIVLLKDQANSG
jgi:hypothetical protein